VVSDAEAARFRLNVAVAALLTRFASEHPLALVIDDLHWADTASLRMLQHLAGELRHARILVIGTYRDIEVVRDHPLFDALASVARLPVVERIMLSGLGVEDIGSYVSSVAGHEPTHASVRMIYERTEGNPFFVAELARLLESEGALDDTSPALGSAIPANVRDVILRRVSGLPEGSERVLTSAAVIGREFAVDVLASVERLDLDAVLDAIEPAIASRVLVETPAAVGRYGFSHALVRETLYDNLTTVGRARRHLRVAESLEERQAQGDVGAAEIAHHFFQAAGAGAADKAADYAISAADQAVTQLGFEEAEEQLTRALEVLELVAPGPDRSRRELAVQTRLGRLLMMIRGYAAPGVESALVRARDLSRELGDTDQLVACLWRLFAMHQTRTDTAAAISVSEELFEATRKSGDATTRWMGHQAKGVAAWLLGDLLTAKMHLEKALALTHSADASASIAHREDPVILCLGALGFTRWLLGERREGRALIDEQLARARDLGHPFDIAYSLMFQARLGVFERDAPLVRKRSEELVAVAKQRGFHHFEAVGIIFRGWADSELGDIEAGSKQILEGMDAFDNTGARMMSTVFFALLAEAHHRAGRAQDALAAVDRGLAEAESFGERFYEAELYRLRGELLLEVSPEKTAEAESFLSRALEIARAQGAKPFQMRVEASLEDLV
jgi:predicted ATPase